MVKLMPPDVGSIPGSCHYSIG